MERRRLIAWIGILIFAALGAALLRYAPHIQNFFVADVDRRSRLTRAVSFYNYVRRSGYPYVLRMLGGMCLVCACAMLWAAYR